MSKTTESKRGRGRPRNAALDALEKELAVSRRHASTMLREMKRAGAGASENSEKPVSPLAEARLEKVLKETELLEHKVRCADLERRALERELIYQSEAVELLTKALAPMADGLRTWPKGLSPRLVGQSMQSIEDTLAESVNRLLEVARRSIADFKGKTL